MMKVLLLLFLVGLCKAQLGFDTDTAVSTRFANMPQITKLDVECTLDGMTVDIQFSTTFNGIIFSKGFWSSAGCRYVQANSGRSSYQFVVPMTTCGTQGRDVPQKLFHNTLIVQMDEYIQEIWDSARMITCLWQNNVRKTVTFRPYAVGMLDVQRLNFSGDDVSCWMQVQRGRGPFANELNGVVRIGEELTVAVFVDDGGSNYDVLVSNCYAYSSRDFTNAFASSVRLTDDNGCLLKPKLLGYFQRTKQTSSSGASIISYAYMNAFKFPDKTDMFLTCEVELCKGGCAGHCNTAGYPKQLITSGSIATKTGSIATPQRIIHNVKPSVVRPVKPALVQQETPAPTTAEVKTTLKPTTFRPRAPATLRPVVRPVVKIPISRPTRPRFTSRRPVGGRIGTTRPRGRRPSRGPVYGGRLNRELKVEDLEEEASKVEDPEEETSKVKRSISPESQSTKLRFIRDMRVVTIDDLGLIYVE